MAPTLHLVQPIFQLVPLSTQMAHAIIHESHMQLAAWAAILRTPTTSMQNDSKFQVLAAGHCPGLQTINRSELFAMVVAVELVATDPCAMQVTFVTDSQFVANCIAQIEDDVIFRCPHKKIHWDLIQSLIRVWDSLRFNLLKIRSHIEILIKHRIRQRGLPHTRQRPC